MRIGTKFRGENGLDLIYMGFGTAYFPRGLKLENRYAYILASEEKNIKNFHCSNDCAFFVSKNPVKPMNQEESLSTNINIYNPVILLSYHRYDGFHPGVFVRDIERKCI